MSDKECCGNGCADCDNVRAGENYRMEMIVKSSISHTSMLSGEITDATRLKIENKYKDMCSGACQDTVIMFAFNDGRTVILSLVDVVTVLFKDMADIHAEHEKNKQLMLKMQQVELGNDPRNWPVPPYGSGNLFY